MTFIIAFIIKWMFGPIIAIIVGIIAKEPLKKFLMPRVFSYGSRKGGIEGIWKATFTYTTYSATFSVKTNSVTQTEIIEIKKAFGQVIGRIVPHELNHENIKEIEFEKPIRITGSIKDNRFLTGEWFHPVRKNHHQGAFKLLINTNQENMNGIWVGFSESKNEIESGKWEWEYLKK